MAAAQAPAPQSEQPPQTPRIQAEQKPKYRIRADEKAHGEPQSAPQSSSLVPSVLPKGDQGEGESKTQDNRDEGTEFWPAFHGYRLKITDTIIAAFTAALFLATIALWMATRNLVRGAEKTAERQLRAYVLVEKIVRRTHPSGRFMAEITVKNYGATPAREATVASAARLIHLGEECRLIDPTPSVSRIILGPGAAMMMKAVNEDSTIPTLHAGKLESEFGSAFYVFGAITYVDVFGQKRTTKFRSIHTMTSQGESIIPCLTGNEDT